MSESCEFKLSITDDPEKPLKESTMIIVWNQDVPVGEKDTALGTVLQHVTLRNDKAGDPGAVLKGLLAMADGLGEVARVNMEDGLSAVMTALWLAGYRYRDMNPPVPKSS